MVCCGSVSGGSDGGVVVVLKVAAVVVYSVVVSSHDIDGEDSGGWRNCWLWCGGGVDSVW